jgi:PTS system mannose-specific IID component
MLMQYVVKKKLDLIYYLIGFILVAVFKAPIIPVVLAGLLFAYMDTKYTPSDQAAGEQKFSMGNSENKQKLLSTKDVRKAYWSWMFWNLSVQNFERMKVLQLFVMLGKVKESCIRVTRQPSRVFCSA